MAFLGKNFDQITNSNLQDLITQGLFQFIPARVTSVDKTVNLSNGSVIAEVLNTKSNLPSKTTVQASPFFPNFKSYPLENEVVFLITSPTGDYSSNTGQVKYYYLTSLNIWNSVNANPTPNPYTNLKSQSQNKSISEIELGSSNKSNQQDTNEFKPGTYFTEKANVFPLYPFEGDVILEGRFGNSIRFGSTDISYDSKTTEKVITRKYSGGITYTSGGTNIDPTFTNKLSVINNQVGQFFSQYSDNKISITIESSESQTTNPSNIEPGGLALIRADKVKTLLLSFSNLRNNISINTKIGDVPYVIGVDNPLDPKYLVDQFTTVTVIVQGSETTSAPSKPNSLNNWSTSGSNGDPITIIRNGQSLELTGPAQYLITEDINKDQSSIWMTSTQKVPLNVSSTNEYLSYPIPENKPTAINQYSGKQILITSGRLVFNTTEDHLMLSSAKSINLNAQESINFDTTGDTIFQSNKVYLGGTKNSQPVILGDEMVNLLTDVLSDLNFLCGQISNQLGVPTGAPLEPLASSARIVKSKIGGYKTRLKNSLSSTTKTV